MSDALFLLAMSIAAFVGNRVGCAPHGLSPTSWLCFQSYVLAIGGLVYNFESVDSEKHKIHELVVVYVLRVVVAKQPACCQDVWTAASASASADGDVCSFQRSGARW